MFAGISPEWLIAVLWPILAISWIINLVLFLLQARGLFMINKKLWEPNPWMSFVPVLNIYSFVRAAWKPWIWILWLIIGFIFFIIPGLIMIIMLLNCISKRTWNWVGTTILLLFFPYVMFPVVWYNLKEWWVKQDSNSFSL